MEKLFFIGPCGGGGSPKNGATAKNYHILLYLNELGIGHTIIDTERWKHNPLTLFKLAAALFGNPNAVFIFSADSPSVYRVLRILSLLHLKRNIIYWVIGGSMPQRIKDGTYNRKIYKNVKWFLVEGKGMKATLEECGFTGKVIHVTNCKNIHYIPPMQAHNSDMTKFVFMSRIIPEKGCNLIFEAAGNLSQKYSGRFSIDFYGPIDDSYKDEFISNIQSTVNTSYKGFLHLSKHEGFDSLASYDAMLFPTFWHGEGFPGIMIDAFVCNLPIIASDWNMNAEIIQDGRNGLLCKPQSVDSLAAAMERIITDKALAYSMSENCHTQSMAFDIHNVVSPDLLTRIGITGH